MSKRRRPGWLRWVVIVIALVLYAVACTQPGTVVGFGHWQGPATGLALLVFRWAHGLSVAALAVQLPLARRTGASGTGGLGWALACSVVGLLVASLVLLPLPELGESLLDAKWWWLGSHAALAAGCGLAWCLTPASRPLTQDLDFSDPVGVKSSD